MSDQEDDLYADLCTLENTTACPGGSTLISKRVVLDGGAEQTASEEPAPAASGADSGASAALDDPPEPSKSGSAAGSGSGSTFQPPTRTIATWEDGQIQQPSRQGSGGTPLGGSSTPSNSTSYSAGSSAPYSRPNPANLPPPGTRADVPQAARFDDG